MHPKKRFHQNMVSKKVPKRLWDYGLLHQARILSSIGCGKTGHTGVEEVTGQTPEISEWLDFELYDRVWWIDKKNPSTMYNNIIIERCLGVLQKIGSNMCYWVLKVLGKVIEICRSGWMKQTLLMILGPIYISTTSMKPMKRQMGVKLIP